MVDARFRYADGIRSVLALAAYPLQRVATAPFQLFASIGGYLTTQTQLVAENDQLKARSLELAQDAQRYQAAQAEAEQLRRIVSATERVEIQSMPAEILYSSRDPYAHKIFIDRGATHGVRPGSPVADDHGILGQVTRVHPLLSEVTLVTDQDQAIPVQVVRSGLRAVAFGGGASGMLELRFMSANAEIQTGDLLVTSGIDGTYPAGLPVARVTRIERDAEHSFARVVCKPAAGVDSGRYVLVLHNEPKVAPPPRPDEAQSGKERRDKGRRQKGKAGGDEVKARAGDGAR